MAREYFENFPELEYNGQVCKDITRRSIIRPGNTTSPFNFYPYELQNHMRPDHVAEYYYDEPYYDWLILMSNDIIDPYYGWYKTDEQLTVALEENYTTVEESQQRVLYYRNNWAEDTTQISKDYYDNNLALTLRKYYRPVYGPGLEIVAYERKPDDHVQNTNKIIEYSISSNSSSVGFNAGELCNIRATGTETNIGFAEIETANSTVFRIKNVRGTTTANSTQTLDIVGRTTGANVQSSNSNVLFENISDTESVFYSPVYAYDEAVEENEDQKNLNLIGDGVATLYVDEFERLMLRDVDPETRRAEE